VSKKKGDGLAKLYGRLTPSERFRLDVEAQARGDEKESERLVESCPIRSYTMPEYAFSARWRTTTEMVLAACMDLSQHMSRLSMIDVLLETLPAARNIYSLEAGAAYLDGHKAGSFHAWRAAGMEGDPPGWTPLDEDGELEEGFDPAAEADLERLEGRIDEADVMPELVRNLEKEVTQRAWTVWEAFCTFSREELEIEPEKLVKVLLTPVLPDVEDLKRRREALGVEADEELLSEYAAALSGIWERHLSEARRLTR
jgi:hypothetical protein